jgi:hypothetical protein
LLKARIVKPAETALAIQWHSSRCVLAARDTHATIEEVLEEGFSVRSVPRLYNEDQWPERESAETAFRRAGDWCEMAASLRGREAGNRGFSAVGRCEHRD